jgi:hypothetical protein
MGSDATEEDNVVNRHVGHRSIDVRDQPDNIKKLDKSQAG